MTSRIYEDIERVMELVDDLYWQDDAALTEMLKGVPLGTHKVNDYQHFLAIEEIQRRYPPAMIDTPLGPLFMSPWRLAMSFVENGPEEIERYERVKEEMRHG